MVSMYKKLQATKMVQLFSSSDPGVRKAADLRLEDEGGRQRVKFRPAALVDSIMKENPSQRRKAYSGAAKTLLAEEEEGEAPGTLPPSSTGRDGKGMG